LDGVRQVFDHQAATETSPYCQDSLKDPTTTMVSSLVGCSVEMKRAWIELDTIKRKIAVMESRVRQVDECLTVYHATIDKRLSDLTGRESDQINTCRSAEMYPPTTDSLRR
jgi:hypothetical protein